MQLKLRHVLTMFCAAIAPLAQADAMTVQPVVVDLQNAGRNMSQVITVENTFTTPLPVELTVQALELSEDGVRQTHVDPGDLLVFPPQALIAPGQTQTFRVQYIGDPELAASKHYYVTVAQLPVKLPEGQSGIQILYNFQVLVSVAPTGVKPALSVESAAIGRNAEGKPVPVVMVHNAAKAHGYLSNGNLRITVKKRSGETVLNRTLSGAEIQQTIGFGLIGGDQTRKVTVPIELPIDDGTVEASFAPAN